MPVVRMGARRVTVGKTLAPHVQQDGGSPGDLWMDGSCCPTLVPAAASHPTGLRALEVAGGTPLGRGYGNKETRPFPSVPLCFE